MKPTGIVRRMDELGRVVMPKELRRTLRIKEGDPLEVYVSGNSVILKRYAPNLGEIGDFAQDYAKTLAEVTGHIALVANTEVFVAVAGAPQREFINKPLPDIWVESTKTASSGIFEYTDEENSKARSVAYGKILNDGSEVGAVFLLSKVDASPQMEGLEIKLTNTAANFIAKQMK